MELYCDFYCPKCLGTDVNIIITRNEFTIKTIEDSVISAFIKDGKYLGIIGTMRIVPNKVISYMLCNSCQHIWNEI